MGIAPSEIEKQTTEGSEWYKALKAAQVFCCQEVSPKISDLLDEQVPWWQDTYVTPGYPSNKIQNVVNWIEKNSLIYFGHLGK